MAVSLHGYNKDLGCRLLGYYKDLGCRLLGYNKDLGCRLLGYNKELQNPSKEVPWLQATSFHEGEQETLGAVGLAWEDAFYNVLSFIIQT